MMYEAGAAYKKIVELMMEDFRSKIISSGPISAEEADKSDFSFDTPWTEEELEELGKALDEILALENATQGER